jgi:PKD repeat protein
MALALASVAVACLLSVTGGAPALAAAHPRIRVGAIGGVVKPVAIGGARAARPRSETYGGPSASGSSPGGGTPPLLYGGGPVMHDVTTQVVAWAPSADPFPGGYVSGFEQYLADTRTALGLSSNISALAAQYLDASGPALSSLTNNTAIIDTDAYPSTGGCKVAGTSVCLTESQILTELTNVIAADALPVDESHSYIVLLPPGVDSCVGSTSSDCETQAFCGYHTAFSIAGATTTFTLLPYTESSYSNSAGQCYIGSAPAGLGSALDGVDSIGAHELFESATDPLVGSGYVDSSGEEVGDECAWTWGPYSAATGGGDYNQLLGGDQYLIQEMWSNQADACELGATATAEATISPGTASLGTPTSLSVALSGDSAAPASYQWSDKAPNGAVSSDFSTAASPSLTFTSAGTYTVWMAVTDTAGGTVTGVSRVAVSSLPAPTASFGYSPSTSVPATGSAVSFTSSSTASSAQSITASSWSFGDGATASGATASHSYSSAGTYTVTLRVTQTNGQSSSISHSITVAAPRRAQRSASARVRRRPARPSRSSPAPAPARARSAPTTGASAMAAARPARAPTTPMPAPAATPRR